MKQRNAAPNTSSTTKNEIFSAQMSRSTFLKKKKKKVQIVKSAQYKENSGHWPWDIAVELLLRGFTVLDSVLTEVRVKHLQYGEIRSGIQKQADEEKKKAIKKQDWRGVHVCAWRRCSGGWLENMESDIEILKTDCICAGAFFYYFWKRDISSSSDFLCWQKKRYSKKCMFLRD